MKVESQISQNSYPVSGKHLFLVSLLSPHPYLSTSPLLPLLICRHNLLSFFWSLNCPWHIWVIYVPVKFYKPTKAFSTLVSKKTASRHKHFIDSWRMLLSSSIPLQWNMSQTTPLQRDKPHFPLLALKHLQKRIFSAHLPAFLFWVHRTICLND